MAARCRFGKPAGCAATGRIARVVFIKWARGRFKEIRMTTAANPADGTTLEFDQRLGAGGEPPERPRPWATAPQPGARIRIAPRRPRHSVWPYAGALSGVAAGASTLFLAQGSRTFDDDFVADTNSVYEAMNSAGVQMIGAGLGFVSLLASVPFLVGLLRHVELRAPHRAGLSSALRLVAAAFIGSTSIGVLMHYVAAGGSDGGVDESFYTREASTTLGVLADQMNTGTYLPGLILVAIVGFLAARDRVLPRCVGIVSILLAAGSSIATIAVGLPYSSGLVVPLFMLLVGGAGVLTRKAT
jgi:putative flippase GtrA